MTVSERYQALVSKIFQTRMDLIMSKPKGTTDKLRKKVLIEYTNELVEFIESLRTRDFEETTLFDEFWEEKEEKLNEQD